ncbi:MAG: DUF3581 domain-containing protein [Gammaproteobacteria bacterium]|nr:MAG: DUF3581 domain-containing protein [Gammaproteobacteria bacterium]RLA62180.1 MAG: DUF3581 domain-containing protein [Gammaproteobacteria bacterium]
MFLDQYFSEHNGKISFTREQGSDFAKCVADDFNPLHDADARRFCIPGDLLFSIMLSKYGLSRHMEFIFSGMVVAGVELVLPESLPDLHIKDTDDREYLSIHRSGDNSTDESMIQYLTRDYVEFSGHTFPHILVPLLAEQNVMINPYRPMVMYQSMIIDLDTLDIKKPSLEIDHNELQITGKRGNILLAFNLMDSGKVIGRGKKHMLVSGLCEYEQSAVEELTASFDRRKQLFSRDSDVN